MKIAFTIGSYRLSDFIKLGIKQIQKLSPDSPILVSDDRAQESAAIEKIAEEHGCAYLCSRVKRGHFAQDFQAIANALAFAQANDCDVAVKVSQRFIFRKPEAIDVIRKTFEDPNILVATPGRPSTPGADRASKGFSNFSILTDIVCIRVGCITPDELIAMYREKVNKGVVPWASFVECAIDNLHSDKFHGRTARIAELTNPTDEPIYLRRYQAKERQYKDLALGLGFSGCFPLAEWGCIERNKYNPKPMVV